MTIIDIGFIITFLIFFLYCYILVHATQFLELNHSFIVYIPLHTVIDHRRRHRWSDCSGAWPLYEFVCLVTVWNYSGIFNRFLFFVFFLSLSLAVCHTNSCWTSMVFLYRPKTVLISFERSICGSSSQFDIIAGSFGLNVQPLSQITESVFQLNLLLVKFPVSFLIGRGN